MFESAQYIISTVNRSQSPNTNNLPEFIFLGRSNVGKSSFINAICQRKMLAKTSSKPGKTQTINYFLIDNKFYLCDAPGYGYASKSVDNRLDYGKYIEDFIHDNNNLKIVFLLVDTFVGPTKDDILMYDYLMYHHLNVYIVATKSDKIPKTRLISYKKNIFEKLKITDKSKVFLTSSQEKIGFSEIIDKISEYIVQ